MYSHVVFTGGGLTGLSYVGVVRYLQEHGLHRHVHEVAGTSMGSLFACLFAMNVLAGDIEDYIKHFFRQEENISYPLIGPVMTLLNTYGLDDGERMVRPLRHFMKQRYGWTDDVVTIRDFVKKTGVEVVICAASLSSRGPVYFNIDETPDVNIYDAVKASMAVPIMVRPVDIKGTLYVDGGISDNLPIKGCKITKPNTVLVVITSTIVEKETVPSNFVNYVGILAQTMLNNTCDVAQLGSMCTDYDLLLLDNAPIAFLRFKTYDDVTIKIDITDEDVDAAVVHGYTKAYEFMKNKEKKGVE